MASPFRDLTADQVAAINARNKASRSHTFEDAAPKANPIPSFLSQVRLVRQGKRQPLVGKVGKTRPPTPTSHSSLNQRTSGRRPS